MRAHVGCFVTLVVLLSSCTTASSASLISTANTRSGRPTHGNDGAQLTQQEISTLEKKALLGDGAAALRLRAYYDFWKVDLAKGQFWQTIALEDGSLQAILTETAELSDSTDPRAWIRARYWLNILMKNPDYRHAAQVGLEDLDKKESR
jgi:hypothetical protein